MANRLGGSSSGGGGTGTGLTPGQTAAIASIPLKADQTDLDAEINATNADITAHGGRLTTLELLPARITTIEAEQTTQNTELTRLENEKADKTELPRNLTNAEAIDGTSVEFGLTNGAQIAQSVRDHSPLPSFVANDAALRLVDVTGAPPFIERYNQETGQLALYHPTLTTGDVAPAVGPGSWFYVGAKETTLEDTVDGQALEWQREYVLHPGFTYTFPAVTEDFGTNWLIGLPANGNWQSGFNSAAHWTADGTDTLGATQNDAISATAGELRFIGRTGTPNNIEVFVNAGINTVQEVGEDSSAPINTTVEMTPDNTVLVRIPPTGTFVTGAPQSSPLINGALVEMRPLATIAANTVSAPITPADALLFELVGQGATDTPAKNVFERVAGDFTAQPMNDSGIGADGRLYYFDPNANITFPALSTMDPANGIYRLRMATNWSARASALPVPTYTTDGVDGLDVPGGWPVSGADFVDIIADVANGQWIVA